MQWSDEANTGFSKAPAKDLYLPVDDSSGRPTVADQENDPHSLLNYVRLLVKTRHELDALDADAHFEVVYAKDGALPFVYSMTKLGQKVLIALNPSNRAVSLQLPENLKETEPVTITKVDDSAISRTTSGWELTLGPVSGALYRVS